MQKNIRLEEVCNFLSKNRMKRFLITFHSMGDRDGVGSALAISKYLKNSLIVTPDFITHNAKSMLSQIGFKQKIKPDFPEDVEAIIVLDANNLDALGPLKAEISSSTLPILFIDHHLFSKQKTGQDMLIFNDESYNSTASMICDVLRKLNYKMDSSSSIALLNGIISDSSEFHNANSHTFRQIADLVDYSKVSYSEIMGFFIENATIENRYNLFSDIKRAKIELVGRYMIVSGNSTSHANIVADMAIKLGADAAVFWKQTKEEVSISSRLRPSLDTKFSIHLGKVMRDVGPMLDGAGGGHPCAAGAYGPNKAMSMKAVDKVLNELRSKFRNK